MRPWQERALRKGRTPLPEGPGERPWVNQSAANNELADRENDSQETSDPRAPATSTPAEAVRTHATRAYTASHADAGPAAAAAAAAAAADAGARPAEATDTADTADTVDEVTAPEASSATPGATESSAPSYTFWRTDDLRRLIEMRNGGAKWASIAAAFPERTLEALKQTYHKRRHAMEAQMAEEQAASSEPN